MHRKKCSETVDPEWDPKANYPRSEAERDTAQAKRSGFYTLDLLKYI